MILILLTCSRGLSNFIQALFLSKVSLFYIKIYFFIPSLASIQTFYNR